MSVRVDATADRLSHAGSVPAPASGITITAWVKIVNDRNDHSTWCRVYDSGQSTIITASTDNDGTTGNNYFTAGGSASNGVAMGVGTWRPVAVSHNVGTTGKAYVRIGTTTTVNSATVGSGTPAGICVGGRGPADATEWFDGEIAQVRVWSAELTQAQIEAEWASTTPVVTSNLWANWPLATNTDLTDTVASRVLAVQSGGALTTGADSPPQSTTITRTIGQAVETSSATAVTRRKVRTIAAASSPETGQSLTRTKTRAAAQAATQELAQPFARRKVRVIGQAVETGSATAVARAKLRSIGQAAGPGASDTAQPLTRRKVRTLGRAVETSSAGAITPQRTELVVDVDQAAELDEARPIRPVKVARIGQAGELGTARALGRAKTRTVAAAVELSTAAAVTARHITRRTIGQAVEEALAGAVGRRKLRGLGRADELDRAGGIRNTFEATPPTRLTAGHAATATLVAAHGGRSRLEARHG